MLQRLAQALNAGDHVAAGAILGQLRQQTPGDPNVRLFGAIFDRQQGRLIESHAALADLHGMAPQHPGIRFHLANTLKELQRRDEAALLYRGLVEEQPGHADAAFNLASCLREHQPEHAGRWFLQARRWNPGLADACQAAMECAASVARSGPAPMRPIPAPTPADALISVICCSIDRVRFARLRQSLEAALAGFRWELILIDDARSICEGYNRGIARALGDRIVLCHDDIRIHAPDFATRLLHHLERFDLIGVAGTTRCCGPAALWAGPPHVHGWVVYSDGTRLQPSICSPHGPVIAGAQALDGLFLAARRSVFEQLDFDESTFDRFHLYDIDFSWRAHLAGLRIAICQDLLIEHASHGEFSDTWREQAERFRRKFPQLGTTPASTEPAIFMINADSEDHVRGIYSWLSHWLAELDAQTPAAVPAKKTEF